MIEWKMPTIANETDDTAAHSGSLCNKTAVPIACADDPITIPLGTMFFSSCLNPSLSMMGFPKLAPYTPDVRMNAAVRL